MDEHEAVEVTGGCENHSAVLEMFCPKDRELAREILRKADEKTAKPRRKRLPKQGQENWVPLRKVFGTAKIPEAVASVVGMALERLKTQGHITDVNLWQGLEWMAANYLSEAD